MQAKIKSSAGELRDEGPLSLVYYIRVYRRRKTLEEMRDQGGRHQIQCAPASTRPPQLCLKNATCKQGS
jgi:hypothetical protein